jgi:hypothetical protein
LWDGLTAIGEVLAGGDIAETERITAAAIRWA